jgi:signal transduction histidine kinase
MDDPGVFFRFAHDLRSGLRTVVTRLQLVQKSEASQLPEEERLWLDQALAAAHDLNGLINAMSAYAGSNTEEGSENLRLLLRGLLLERKPELEKMGGRVEAINELSNPVPGGLKWVLKELLSNACRFRAPERPLRIRIATRLTDSSLAVDVQDNGMGVEETYLEMIFQPFFSVHPRHEFPGYGLGLATCRRMLESWGGSIHATAPGEGLTLHISIPLEKM